MAVVRDRLEAGTSKDEVLGLLVNDFYASSRRAPRNSQIKTWEKYHELWYGDRDSAWPLTEQKLIRASALFKLGGYKSFKNYMSRAKDNHVSLGHAWTDKLDSVARKCSRSVLRGLAGSSRSMDFDLSKVAYHFPIGVLSLDENGAAHPTAMIVTATMFLLRELEASAIDVEDASFSDLKVTLHLPVSKTDWQAKGCSRSWTCACDTQLPCVFHILEAHVKEINSLSIYGRVACWKAFVSHRIGQLLHQARSSERCERSGGNLRRQQLEGRRNFCFQRTYF